MIRMLSSNFNPRTPRGVRLDPLGGHLMIRYISIHAPRGGCDGVTSDNTTNSNHFNPRTPRGVRRARTVYKNKRFYFNPRTPRGVRPTLKGLVEDLDTFQSTHPAGGATQSTTNSPFNSAISIHAPRGGCDCVQRMHRRRDPISIHAPRGGCDRASVCVNDFRIYFNPRTPRGVRQR